MSTTTTRSHRSRRKSENTEFWNGLWLNKEYPKVKGCGTIAPPPNHRRTGAQVTAWRMLTEEQQKQEIVKWKKLCKDSRELKRKIKEEVPGSRTPPKRRKRDNRSSDNQETGANVNENGTNNDEEYTPHGFTNSERNGIAVTSYNRRRRGDRPTKISHQGSKAVQDAYDDLVMAAAVYVQTSTLHKHNHNGLFNDPNMHMVLAIYRNVNETKVRGGRNSKDKQLRSKPKVTIVSSRREAVRDTCSSLNEFIKLKRDPNNDHGKDWDILFADDYDDPKHLVEMLKNRRSELKTQRSVPKGGVLTSDETEEFVRNDFGTLIPATTTP